MSNDSLHPAMVRLLLLISLLMGDGTASAAATDPSMPAHLTLRVPSKVLAETRVINVYVPPDYSGKADKRYPVLYMLDGGEQEDFPHLVGTLDALIKAGTIPPMLLVGIENTERRRDMTGPTTVESDRRIAPLVGGSSAFRQFIAEELRPQIHAFYKVNDDAAIIGESLAGLFVIETLFVQADLFGTYIAIDPSLWWNAEQWWREAGTRLNGSVDISARLFLAAAGDSAGASAHFADALCRNPLPNLHWTYARHAKLRHANIYRKLEKSLLTDAFSGQAMKPMNCE
ncbi:MAG TPA: alpha/beta hydrolase-fold protein [Dokdonella sp.]|nr:alpha/beta hydrolase-fold protein [Dokdonella sp.]